MKNKIKKYIKRVALGTILSAGLIGCSKYLDEEPITTFSEVEAFKNIENAKRVLVGAYANMAGDFGFGVRASLFYPMGTDEAVLVTADYDDGERRSISRYTTTASNRELLETFSQWYDGVERSNICIDNIPRMATYSAGTTSEIAETRRMYGEALTLRALYYLELIKTWGDLPAIFLPVSKQTERFYPKEDRDVIFEKLLEDLLIAEEHLPWRNEVTADERITKAAAKGLRAKIALFRGGYALRRQPVQMIRGADHIKYYTIARDECKGIIESGFHNLAPTQKDLFQNYICKVETPVDPYGELIFQVAMAGDGAASNSKLGYASGPRTNGGTLGGNGYVQILPTALYAFDAKDKRKSVAVAPYNLQASDELTKVGIDINVIHLGKFRRDWLSKKVTSQNTDINWPLIRYADILLMFAEAENEINNGATMAAVEAFEKVRKRGFAGDEASIGTTPTGKDAFFSAIVKERMLEFMGEGIRKYDLIRWNLLASKIVETKANLAKMVNREVPYQNVPLVMYVKNNTQSDDMDQIFATSMYDPNGPSGANDVPGATRVRWAGNWSGAASRLTTHIIPYFAPGFVPSKSELFPLHEVIVNTSRLPQDYGY